MRLSYLQKLEGGGGVEGICLPMKTVLNWANCLFAEHTSDSSTNCNSFLNLTLISPNMVRTVRRTMLRS